MKNKAHMRRLSTLTKVILDLRLAELEQSARARAETLDRLADLNKREHANLTTIAEFNADLLYQRWADGRRAEINMVLARQTAEWLTRQDTARRALGQTQALGKLLEG